MLMLLLIATFIGGGVGLEVGLNYSWWAGLLGAQLGATLGVILAAAVGNIR